MKKNRFEPFYGVPFGFPVMPDASSLIDVLTTDPEALKNERHDPGVYDENGDYVPQYSDNPEDISMLVVNSLGSSEASVPGTDGDSSESSSSDSSASSESAFSESS